MKRMTCGLVIASLIIALCGCGGVVYDANGVYTDGVTAESVSEAAVDEDNEQGEATPPESGSQPDGTTTEAELADYTDESPTAVDIESIPGYDGEPYVEVSGNVPDFSDEDKTITDAFEIYSELDSLGRCTQAYANICRELQPMEERGEIGQIKPSGWHTVKYNDLIDGNYLYNRCHLIGYQLAGENANERNLITGTRYLNVVGMLYFENMVDDYVDATGNHVLYRVTPVFEGNNLVASGVQMEGWSVEDAGEGICFNVYCYNVQPGIEIDYATGDSHVAEKGQGDKGDEGDSQGNSEQSEWQAAGQNTERTEESDSEQSIESAAAEQTYILNTNTKKFHLPSCSSVSQMKEENKKSVSETADELEAQGYSPCKRCLGGGSRAAGY